MKDPDPLCVDLASLEHALQHANQRPGDPLSESLEDARARYDDYLKFLAGHRDPPPIFQDITVPARGTNLRVRVVWPAQAHGDVPVVYLRGGGWWSGSLDSSLPFLHAVANGSGLPACAVDYRLTPEFRYPAQLHDSIDVLAWMQSNGESLGLNTERCVLWGESAGATLAACTALEIARMDARKRLDPDLHRFINGLVLLYGNFGGPRPDLSPRSRWVWEQYLGNQNPDVLNRAVVLRQSLTGFPPCWLGAGDGDPLLVDSVEFASALSAAGVAHTLRIYPELPHSFFPMASLLAPARQAANDAYQAARAFAIS